MHKIVLFLLIFAISLGPILAQKSYGQAPEAIGTNSGVNATLGNETQAQIQNAEVVIQIKLYDSSGNFVGYTIGHPQHVDRLNNIIYLLTFIGHKSTIIKDGKTFEMLQATNNFLWPNAISMGTYSYSVSYKGVVIGHLDYLFDSFPVLPGDTPKAFITIIWPAR